MVNEKKEMYRGHLELPATIKEDKKQRADLIETLLKAINILRDGNDISFALEFIKRHTKGIKEMEKQLLKYEEKERHNTKQGKANA